MISSIAKIKDEHKGKDIYVIGAGASIDSYDPRFFQGRVTIGCNYVYQKIPVSYTVFTHNILTRAIGKTKCVVCEIDPDPTGGNQNVMNTDTEYWTFKVGKYCSFEENLNDIGKDDTLCMGNSIAVSAANFAAHLGAKNIFLVGVDCCIVNGKINYDGYYDSNFYQNKINDGTTEVYRQHSNDFMLRNAKELKALKKRIKEVYGSDILTISPYVGLKPEDVVFKDYLTVQDMQMLAKI